MTHRISLAWYEHALAAHCGVLRNVEANRKGLKRTYSSKPDIPDGTHINAAGAEMALAKFMHRYWYAGVNCFDDPDVFPNVEVRCTTNPQGRLIVRADAADDRPYVLVRGLIPDYEIVGWILGSEAKRPEFLARPNGEGECYMVPASALTEFVVVKKGESDVRIATVLVSEIRIHRPRDSRLGRGAGA